MSPQVAAAAVVAALIRDADSGRLLLAQRPEGHGTHPGKWEFPGGKRRGGESLDQCLVRELSEELDVEVVPGRCLGTVDRPPFRLYFFEAAIRAGPPRAKVHARLRWVEPEHLLDHDLLEADRVFAERGLRVCAER